MAREFILPSERRVLETGCLNPYRSKQPTRAELLDRAFSAKKA